MDNYRCDHEYLINISEVGKYIVSGLIINRLNGLIKDEKYEFNGMIPGTEKGDEAKYWRVCANKNTKWSVEKDLGSVFASRKG